MVTHTPTKEEMKALVHTKQRLYAIIMKDNSRSPELEKLSQEIAQLNAKIYLKKVLIMIVLICSLSACASSGNWYWTAKHHNGVEKTTHLVPGWPSDYKCSAYRSRRPVKISTVRRYHHWKPRTHARRK